MQSLSKQVVNATKWSTISEVMGKLVAPISSMALARLLTPEAFGVVATLNMVIAFAEVFTDAGFQKYLIQQPFKDTDERDKDTNVAFWTNLGMSFLIWGGIAIFAEPLATLVGNPGLGNAIVVACASIPLAAFSSIQMALFKKDFNFKTLFYRRLISILIPFFVTIPLAVLLRSYWSLVIGTICINLANAILLTVKSNWHPNLYYDFKRLRKMFSFCSWSILDSILVWATGYLDIFFIGVMLNEHVLGLYKTSMTTVASVTGIITASILPVIMPALAKVQNDFSTMRSLIFNFQKYTSLILLPIGFGMFAFQDLITELLLGKQWMEAAPFIGLWGLIDVLMVIFTRFCSIIYPSIGRPDIAFLSQILHIIILIPAVYIAVKYGFKVLYITRSLVRLEGMAVNMFFAYYLIRLSPWRMILNVFPELLGGAFLIAVEHILLKINNSTVCSLLWVFFSGTTYIITLCFFSQEKRMFKQIFKKLALRFHRIK